MLQSSPETPAGEPLDKTQSSAKNNSLTLAGSAIGDDIENKGLMTTPDDFAIA